MDTGNKTAPIPPTQDFVEVESIKNDVVVLKGGGLRKIVMVSGINFDLKSEDEQSIILSAFQNFLNALDFTIQIFVHSRKLNIDGYLETLNARSEQETNELLKNQITEYREFIRTLVAENAIMNKTYFVVVPYDSVQLAVAGEKLTGGLMGMFGKKKTAAQDNATTEEHFTQALEQLDQRVGQVVSGLNQTGLRVVPLNNEELTELFYNLYNPGTIEKKDLEIAKMKRPNV